MFSTAYGGLGYTGHGVNASVLAGEEYVWLFGESSRWIPVHYSPRVEARADFWDLSLTLAYENAEYQNFKKKESGTRTEWNGSAYYHCGELCRDGLLWFGAGLQFRTVEDEGTVYTGLEDDVVVWPFAQLRLTPLKALSLDATFGVNNRDWLLQDSVEFKVGPMPRLGLILGEKNVAGTRLNMAMRRREKASRLPIRKNILMGTR